MNLEPQIAFAARSDDPPALEIRINFGILAGRDATPAEIDDLARALLAHVQDVSIVSEQHYEVGHGHEATVHQVRVAVDAVVLPEDEPELELVTQQLLQASAVWAEHCASVRHAEL